MCRPGAGLLAPAVHPILSALHPFRGARLPARGGALHGGRLPGLHHRQHLRAARRRRGGRRRHRTGGPAQADDLGWHRTAASRVDLLSAGRYFAERLLRRGKRCGCVGSSVARRGPRRDRGMVFNAVGPPQDDGTVSSAHADRLPLWPTRWCWKSTLPGRWSTRWRQSPRVRPSLPWPEVSPIAGNP